MIKECDDDVCSVDEFDVVGEWLGSVYDGVFYGVVCKYVVWCCGLNGVDGVNGDVCVV